MSLMNHLPYVVINAEGNNPLLLSQPKAWVVQKGEIDLFITKVLDNTTTGSRKYLFSVGEGELLLGVASLTVTEGQFALLAAGHTGAELLEFDGPQFTVLASGEGQEEIAGLLSGWVDKWNGNANDRLDENAALVPSQLPSFNRRVFSQALELHLAEQKAELLRNKLKATKDDARMSSGLRRLMNTLQPKDSAALSEDAFIDNPLFQACVAVGQAKKMTIVPSFGLKNNHPPSQDLLGDIARASQIRTREIILKDLWWKEDNGSLLAYKEAGDQPVALLPLSKSKYVLYDPADGSQVVVDQTVAESVKPQAVTFYRPLPAEISSYKDLLHYLADGIWKSDAAAVLLMGVLGGLLGILTPIVTGLIFDSVIPDGEGLLLTQIGFLLIAIAVTTFAFNLTRSFAMHRIEGRTEADLQAAVWDRLLSLPVPFFKDYTAGELASCAMGISQIKTVLSGVVSNTLLSGIFAIFYYILLYYYSWKLALICTAILVVVMGISLGFCYLLISYERDLVDLNNALSGKIFGLLTGISKIKTAGAEKRAFHNWAQDFSEMRDVTYRKESLANQMAVFNSTVTIVATGIIFYYMLNLKGLNLGAGKFIAFNAAFSAYLAAMLEISAVILQINVIKPLYEKIKPILQTQPEFNQEKTNPGILEGNIEVSHVNFRYHPDGPLILNDVALQIDKGDYVGIVGPSGSGKSTLFRLLLGFEKAESGQIYYDQQDLENIDIQSVRRQLGVVLQGGQLMSGSIFSNIIAAKPGLTLDDAWAAARKAGVDQDIQGMPMGMHTMISETGSTFSGGQKQRLLIARAIISNPKIIFFDEATSALDNKTQQTVNESLANLGATRVVIAHRLSTVVNCNKIIVMDRGRIVEQGSYEELFAKGGLFTKLARRQLA